MLRFGLLQWQGLRGEALGKMRFITWGAWGAATAALQHTGTALVAFLAIEDERGRLIVILVQLDTASAVCSVLRGASMGLDLNNDICQCQRARQCRCLAIVSIKTDSAAALACPDLELRRVACAVTTYQHENANGYLTDKGS